MGCAFSNSDEPIIKVREHPGGGTSTYEEAAADGSVIIVYVIAGLPEKLRPFNDYWIALIKSCVMLIGVVQMFELVSGIRNRDGAIGPLTS